MVYTLGHWGEAEGARQNHGDEILPFHEASLVPSLLHVVLGRVGLGDHCVQDTDHAGVQLAVPQGDREWESDLQVLRIISLYTCIYLYDCLTHSHSKLLAPHVAH